MKLLGAYKNGNYNVIIFDDGTKVRNTKENKFISEFPECIDIKITNYCDMNCPYCHESSSTEGKHGNILNAEFIETLNPYTELAIGGGNPLSHPDLIMFLEKLKEKHIIANMTVNQSHFMNNIKLLYKLTSEGLIKGLGVSLTNPKEKDFIENVKKFPNAVLHVINGIVKIDDLKQLYDNNLKMLILGYKQFRKGLTYYCLEVENNKKELFNYLPEIIEHFEVVSFDNLAIKQLDVKRLMTEEEWNKFYMGDDGKFTMYIDMINMEFAKCSVSNNRHKIMKDIKDMFKIILGED